MSIILFNVMPQLIDILVACTYLAAALKGPWVALIVLFTVGSYVPLTLLITEQRGKVRTSSGWQAEEPQGSSRQPSRLQGHGSHHCRSLASTLRQHHVSWCTASGL